MIRIGTSGFSYDDWTGPVYPPGLPAREQLEYYAREFDTVELNVTFYRIPGLSTVKSWVKRTPDDFLFSVKAFRGLTHEREEPDFAGFSEALRPLLESGKLGSVLAQFPYSFHPVPPNVDYLRRLREGLPELPLVIEFRHSGWATPDTFDFLEELRLGYCCVDEPQLKGLMPPVAIATGPIAYVRFHGRNYAKWYAHDNAWERYDYTYKEKELKEWAPKIEKLELMAETTFAYFNNHYSGQAVQGARDLKQLMLPGAD